MRNDDYTKASIELDIEFPGMAYDEEINEILRKQRDREELKEYRKQKTFKGALRELCGM